MREGRRSNNSKTEEKEGKDLLPKAIVRQPLKKAIAKSDFHRHPEAKVKQREHLKVECL